ncbi:hypothetical protein [Pseudomonas sp. 18173]|uniref:hypothetical protein n=1 Tax=Pseudomonas sp. 18173 TaxID=3390055 RepID=UPI003D1DD9CD
MDELTTLHNAIEATFRAGLPSVVSVEAFPELNAEVGLPAVLFALTEIGEAPDNGSGKTSLSGRFQVCIMVDSTISKAALQAAILAAEISKILRGQYWGLDFVEEVQDVRAFPDDSMPELAQFVVWIVEWKQIFQIGETEWLWPVEPPGSLYLNVDGCTGTGNEDHYFQPEDLEWDTPAPNTTE